MALFTAIALLCVAEGTETFVSGRSERTSLIPFAIRSDPIFVYCGVKTAERRYSAHAGNLVKMKPVNNRRRSWNSLKSTRQRQKLPNSLAKTAVPDQETTFGINFAAGDFAETFVALHVGNLETTRSIGYSPIVMVLERKIVWTVLRDQPGGSKIE